MQFSTI